ncbi:MAG TPA: methyltransferase domain-containing protein [Methylomirabilota bacterium]|nr:methyltransferase domain-containing protein [Methylomirabilota bacterium]
MDRVLEPELMTGEDQALAYAKADFAQVNQGFVDRFRACFPKAVGGAMVDLGCGPGDIPVRFAKALPGFTITAVDGSEPMIALAKLAAKQAGVEDRVHPRCARLPMLPLPLQSFDAVVSNSLVHHIPDPQRFWNEVVRLGKPGAAVLIMDLLRPESPGRAREIVEQYSGSEAPVLKEDFFNSLCAAFTLRELRYQIRSRGLGGLVCEFASDRHWIVWGHLPRGIQKGPPP